MDSRDIRQLFVRFFAERGHRHIPSSSLIPPPEERTLLFTNAGMNQMKPYFMGLARPPATRLTSIQKCFRTSDIEKVGDATHHTFFEMLGNFSVGDYFKAEVIPWAWQLLTDPPPQGLGLDKAKLWATVYLDDDESFDLWRGVGIPADRIVRFDESENYWFMIKGGAGPCGPNTEVYYDYGVDQGCRQPDCAPPTHDCGRFVELWNLVFMTLFQDEEGRRTPLPLQNVDTGAGLERWLAPLMWQGGIDWQGKPKRWTQPPTNYDSDLFQPILARVGELAGKAYDEAPEAEQRAMRVVAEHARAATFLIADGVTPANDGRGYVLRRLIRRATAFSNRLKPGFHVLREVSNAVVDLMAVEHPALQEQESLIGSLLGSEEESFRRVLSGGATYLVYRGALKDRLRGARLPEDKSSQVALLNRYLNELERDRVVPPAAAMSFPILNHFRDRLGDIAERPDLLDGRDAFLLADTHGFPIELTQELAEEAGLGVDLEGFEALMAEQRARSRAAATFEGDAGRVQAYAELSLPPSEFLGYETTRAFASVRAILLDGTEPVLELTPSMAAGRRVELVLDQTPFYAEGGGQVGDKGEIVWPQGRFLVEDTQAVGEGGIVAHVGRLEAGPSAEGLRVGEDLRADTMRNHTATHILHAALRQVLGSHVRQAGSLVAPDRLRFDFTHLEALTPAQVRDVEALANKVVRENLDVHIDHQSYEDALAGGALAFFGEKYAETVRVVSVCPVPFSDTAHPEPVEGCFSRELCGGTHCHAAGEVGAIIITGETSIGAGVRRIEAVSGRAAVERLRVQEETLGRLGAALMAPQGEIEARVAAVRDENERLRKQVQALERRVARSQVEGGTATVVGDANVVVRRVEAASADALRDAGDAIKSSLRGRTVILLAAVIDGKPTFLAMATPEVAKRCPAGDVVRAAAQAAGGSGGGRPELAQGGGTDASKIDAALAAGRRLIEEKLGEHP